MAITKQRQLAAWLPADTPLIRVAVVKRALLDVGICEIPPGSNRSGRIDEYNRSAGGAPIGSYWCASAVTAWFREAGAQTPPRAQASCDVWMQWAIDSGLWREEPQPGYAIVYGRGRDANHIGVIVRISPAMISVEGNTSTGAAHERNGIAVWLKHLTGKEHNIIGYIEPRDAA